MKRPVVAISGETPLTDVIDLMMGKTISRLVVVNEDNETKS
jgi:CBS domain-containing protein